MALTIDDAKRRVSEFGECVSKNKVSMQFSWSRVTTLGKVNGSVVEICVTRQECSMANPFCR